MWFRHYASHDNLLTFHLAPSSGQNVIFCEQIKFKCRKPPKDGAISVLTSVVVVSLHHRMSVLEETHLLMHCGKQINLSSRSLNSWEYFLNGAVFQIPHLSQVYKGVKKDRK